MEKYRLKLLKTQRFLPLLITQMLGALNDNLFKSALVTFFTYRIYEHATDRMQAIAIVATAILIAPALIFSSIAGQLGDKFERSKLIQNIKLAEIAIAVLAGLSVYLKSVPLAIGVLFLLGVRSAFFSPAKYAILPEQLSEGELIEGNSLLEVSRFSAILTGMALGGFFVLLPHGASYVPLVMLAIAVAGWRASRSIPESKPAEEALKLNFNFITEPLKITRYAKQYADVYLTMLGIAWFWLVSGSFIAGFSSYAKIILGANAQVIALFLIVFSFGLSLGALLCNKLRLLKGKVHATYVPFGVLGMGVFIFDLYFQNRHADLMTQTFINTHVFLSNSHHWRVFFDLFCLAICAGLYTIPLYALLQKSSQNAHRARLIATSNIISSAFMFLGVTLTVFMTHIGFSILHVLFLLASANLVVAIYVCKLIPDAMLKSFVRWSLTLLYRVEVKGLENYYAAGDRAVIIANHTSFLDGALLAAFLPEKVTFAMNANSVKEWWIRLFLKLVDAYVLDPLNPMQAKSLIEFIRTDKKCVIFPEGRITVTGAIMKVYEAPALIADKSHARILPLFIEGAQHSPFSRLKGKTDIRWFPKITISIFPPQAFDELTAEKGRQRRQKMGYILYDLMTEMMFRTRQTQHTLFHSLLIAKSTHGRGHIICEDIERKPLSYQKFIIRCFILGRYFSKITKAHERVGIMLPNAVTTAALFFGLQAFSRVPAMLNYSTGVKNLIASCQLAQITRVYTSQKFIEKGNFHSVVAALEAAGISVCMLESIRSEVTVFKKLHGMIVSQFARFYYEKIVHRNVKLDPNSPAVVLFTSGSEGVPKGVVLSHANIQANRLQMSAKIDFTPSDTVFNAMPVFHSFGLTGGMMLPFLLGVRVFFYPSPLHYRIVPEMVYDTNSTLLFGTDTFLSNYAKYAHPYDFYSVRYIFSGAERLRDETRSVWAEKFGLRIFEGYGTTETSPVLASNTPMHNKVHSVGRLLPGIEYKLREYPGIKEGKELLVSGPNIMLGYLKQDAPGEIIPPKEGWYETGDIVDIDVEGFITIKGRAKRFAKIAGEMVSLAAVENYLQQLWPSAHHAAVNLPDPKKGEQIILITDYPNATREAIVSFVRQQGIAEISIPKKLIFTEAFPILASGKIDYVTAKDMAQTLIMTQVEDEFSEEDEDALLLS